MIMDIALTTRRHSAAHVMAAAVMNLFDDVKLDIGPATEEGFYYDFDLPHRLTPEDLECIEKEMRRIAGERLPFVCEELSRDAAKALFSGLNQTYKLERLDDIPEGEAVTIYRCGDFVDLCRGPHMEHTGQIGTVKLLTIAGSYYRGNEHNPMLQRIYGTAFANRKELNAYLKRIEEAQKRDHRRLGRELDLFSVSEEVGPGLILWHPRGARIRNVIETFWRETHYKNGYEMLYTPHIGCGELWHTSGHLDCYRDAMYAPLTIDEREYYVKPMNCPFHIEIYRSASRSYRELPLRWCELGTVYRYEKSGVLHGMMRVRGFTQDDAHIFCTPEQIEDEIAETLRFSLYMWKSFGFTEIKAYLATRPEKAVGEDARWEQATASLQKAVSRLDLPCETDEGGGAFYGPKIDLKIRDAIGREWQTTTIQFDFNLPERFDLSYIGEDGRKHRPYMVHRALLGSLERFFGILVEHYAGAFPLWLAPEQARVMPITDAQLPFARDLIARLRQEGIRVSGDLRNEKVGAKIRNARNDRIPYMLVVGAKEVDEGTVAVRTRQDGQLGALAIDELLTRMQEEIREKR